jgi:hypothetical protein
MCLDCSRHECIGLKEGYCGVAVAARNVCAGLDGQDSYDGLL